MSEIDLNLNRHQVECPHCQQETVHFSPVEMILFARAKCSHCGQEFLIVHDEAVP